VNITNIQTLQKVITNFIFSAVSTSQQVLTGESFIVREANQEPIAEG